MEKSKLSFALRLVTRYWFVFLVVAAANAIIRWAGVRLFNYSVLDWGLPAFIVIAFLGIMIKIDAVDTRAISGRPEPPAVMKRLRATIWLLSATLIAMSTLSFFGMSVFTDICDKIADRNECRAYETVLESRNGPIKQVLFKGWAWKPCARCVERGEVSVRTLLFENAVIRRDGHETAVADLSIKLVLGAHDPFMARLIKGGSVHTQDLIESMVAERVFTCLNAVDGWRFPNQVSSVEISCDRTDNPFWLGKIEVKNIKVGKIVAD